MTLPLAHIVKILGGHRYRYESEIQLQDQLAAVMAGAGVRFDREVVLGKGERIDFLIPGWRDHGDRIDFDPHAGIGIEVKVRGSRSEVIRQLFRYAGYSVQGSHQTIAAFILVTDRSQLEAMPLVIRGVPVEVVNLMSGLR